MDSQTVFTKTGKGILAIKNKKVAELARKSEIPEEQLCSSLERLIAEDYIKVVQIAQKVAVGGGSEGRSSLDFTWPGVGGGMRYADLAAEAERNAKIAAEARALAAAQSKQPAAAEAR